MKLFSIADTMQVLKMPAVLDALRDMYTELSNGRAAARVRSDTICATPDGSVYSLKSMDGLLPKHEIGAVRIDSDVITWPTRAGTIRREKSPVAPGGRWTGLVLLFSSRTGEPLAIMPDGYVQRMRVGGTGGIAADLMARQDARILALYGSGWQAGSALLATCLVREFDEVRVYSPNSDHLGAFCSEMSKELGREVIAGASPEAIADGADVVLAATNSLDPVFRTEWIRPGMHLGNVRHCEFEESAYQRASRIVIHTHDSQPIHTVIKEGIQHFPELDENRGWANPHGILKWDELPTLADVAVGRVPGRKGPEEVTCFVSNIGLGVQFAAVGAKLLELTRGTDIGRDFPTEWFTQEYHP